MTIASGQPPVIGACPHRDDMQKCRFEIGLRSLDAVKYLRVLPQRSSRLWHTLLSRNCQALGGGCGSASLLRKLGKHRQNRTPQK